MARVRNADPTKRGRNSMTRHLFSITSALSLLLAFAGSGCGPYRLSDTEWEAQKNQLLDTVRSIYARQKITESPDHSRVVFLATNTLLIPRWPWDALISDGTFSIPSHPPADYRLLLNRNAASFDALLFESQSTGHGATLVNLYGLYWDHNARSWSIISSWGGNVGKPDVLLFPSPFCPPR